ncbi:uncharacterized protein [Ambystoma mexicanum]|uniref:uncharacterized protein n=1 Tax=Ambystoma mexicanum TaxID=8296 RepID=UPI0037E711D4
MAKSLHCAPDGKMAASELPLQCLMQSLYPCVFTVATDEHSFLYPGREFVTAFLQDCQQNPMAVSKLLLIIRAVECCSNANVWVSVPNTPFQNRHQVNQWTVTSVEIPSSAMLLGTSNSTNQTVFITSDRGITVQSISSSSLGFDSSIVYPLGYLGQDYYMLTPISRPGDASYEFAIVNINTSNMVNVTLKGDVVYEQERYPAGSVLNLTLAPFQSIQFQSSMDLTGSRVMAAQPVAVLSGHQCGQRYADLSKGHVYEQLPPVSKWGTTFIVPPLSAQKDEGLVYVVASRATNIEIYTSPSLRSNSSLVAGGALTLGMVPASLYITADHPILVLFYSMGSLLNESPHFTPFIICIIPTEQFVSSYTAYRLSDSINRIVIVAPTSGGSAYTINYNSLQVPAQWKATSEPDPMYRWADVSNSNQYYGQSGNVVYENSRQKFGLYAYTFKDCTEVLSYPFAGIMFVTVFMESWENTERRLELFLHALACCTTVSVSVIGTTFHVYVRLQVGEDARVQIPSSAMLSGTCRSSNSTVIITSNQPITVLSSSSTAMDQDTSVVYPNDFLHTEYHIITPSSNLPLLHEFAIVNLYYRNTVSITIKSYALFDGVEYAGGQTLTVHLSPLQSLQLQSNSSLTGSTVIALNPVAVLSGHQCAQEYPNFSYGFVYEQLPPVFQWGNSFIVPPLSNRSDGDVIYITGSGHTRVQVFNGSSSAVHHSLNEGEALTLYMDANPLYITGNRDLMILFHCSGSLQSSLPLFAPFVFTIMPTKQFSSYHFLQGPCHLSNRMVIVAHHNYRSDIELDNTLLSVLAQWNSTSAASSGHVWTDVTFQQGPHTVHHSSERRIMVYPYSFTVVIHHSSERRIMVYPYSFTVVIHHSSERRIMVYPYSFTVVIHHSSERRIMVYPYSFTVVIHHSSERRIMLYPYSFTVVIHHSSERRIMVYPYSFTVVIHHSSERRIMLYPYSFTVVIHHSSERTIMVYPYSFTVVIHHSSERRIMLYPYSFTVVIHHSSERRIMVYPYSFTVVIHHSSERRIMVYPYSFTVVIHHSSERRIMLYPYSFTVVIHHSSERRIMVYPYSFTVVIHHSSERRIMVYPYSFTVVIHHPSERRIMVYPYSFTVVIHHSSERRIMVYPYSFTGE